MPLTVPVIPLSSSGIRQTAESSGSSAQGVLDRFKGTGLSEQAMAWGRQVVRGVAVPVTTAAIITAIAAYNPSPAEAHGTRHPHDHLSIEIGPNGIIIEIEPGHHRRYGGDRFPPGPCESKDPGPYYPDHGGYPSRPPNIDDQFTQWVGRTHDYSPRAIQLASILEINYDRFTQNQMPACEPLIHTGVAGFLASRPGLATEVYDLLVKVGRAAGIHPDAGGEFLAAFRDAINAQAFNQRLLPVFR